MKKLLLSIVCAIFGISASLAAVPVGQSPVEKGGIPPTEPKTQWQTVLQQPAVQGKDLKGLPAQPGKKAVARLHKTNPAKAPARAAEATATDLVIMDEAALAATVLQQNADFKLPSGTTGRTTMKARCKLTCSMKARKGLYRFSPQSPCLPPYHKALHNRFPSQGISMGTTFRQEAIT